MRNAQSQLDFRIDDWLPLFPSDRFAAAAQTTSTHGPGHICHIEQFRRLAATHGTLGAAVSTDVFVLSYGEAPRRDVTKIGGLPYRPAGKPWPTSKETGAPLTFVGQFRFTDSFDIVGRLPGDILLMFFADMAAAPPDWFPGPPVFEWYPLGIEDLTRGDDVPPSGWKFPICYGARHRTVEYQGDIACERLNQVLPREFRSKTPCASNELARLMCQIDMVKIGGIPYRRRDEAGALRPDKGLRYLGTLPPVVAHSYEALYPWLNVKEAMDCPMLMFSEDGFVDLFVNPNGDVVPMIKLMQ